MVILKLLGFILSLCLTVEYLVSALPVKNCGDKLEFDATIPGTLSSPLYGKQEYDNLLNCTYKISAPKGYRIKLTFKDFDIQPSESCRKDKLTIFNPEKQAVICGSKLPNPILSSEGANKLNLTFETDILIGGRGFVVQYESSPYLNSVCDNGYLECFNRNCYKSNQICNGVDDCGDGTDEENCGKPIDFNPTICGMPQIPPNTKEFDRIVGGQEVIPHSWPWQVSLQRPEFVPNGHFCGGTLINSQWVLTATHCVSIAPHPGMIRIHVGAHDKLSTSEYEQIRMSSKIISYPELQGEEILNYELRDDVSLIKLNAPVTYNKGVHPACLPSLGSSLEPGHHCYVTGWGETRGTGGSDALKQSDQRIQSVNDCRFNESTQICVGKYNNSPCHGDSGGPLNCKFGDNWYIFGCASYVSTANYINGLCTGPGAMTVYASVPKKAEWIKYIINKYS